MRASPTLTGESESLTLLDQLSSREMTLVPRLLLLLLLLTVSGSSCKPDDDDPGVPVPPTPCELAGDRLGEPACVHEVPDVAAWLDLAAPADFHPNIARTTKYLVPAGPDACLDTPLVIDGRWPIHYDFLIDAFPDCFAAMDDLDWVAAAFQESTRQYYSGAFMELITPDGGPPIYSFTVWEALEPRFGPRPLLFLPTPRQWTTVADWPTAPFELAGEEESDGGYEVYSPGVAYGRVRVYSVDDVAQAAEAAEFGFQDILVIDEAPDDLERVVAGVVTGGPQALLSHLNVRSLARGTPNCFVANWADQLLPYEGGLVRMECREDELTVQVVELPEAETWWADRLPESVPLAAPDLEPGPPVQLLQLPVASGAERAAARDRFGAKGANLGVAYDQLDPDLTFPGFVVPFAAYDQFMQTNTAVFEIGGEALELTLAGAVERMLADPAFGSDGVERARLLGDLREAISGGDVDATLVDAVGAAIVEAYGADTVMVRVRSSSNAEDSLRFSGAGLYDSDSACWADDLDGDLVGPSRCDSGREDELTVADAVRDVYRSTWRLGAFEERDWFGLDHSRVAMGLLVTPRIDDEQANSVAFSANPVSPTDDRMVVMSQWGDEVGVVDNTPGVVPELVFLTVSGGVVTKIERAGESSLVPEGTAVVSDSDLGVIGATLAQLDAQFPVDEAPPEGTEIVLDTEWKVLDDGRVVIKQVRPTLR